MNYDLSIIIPFYNSKKFIEKSLRNSLEISKTNSNVEIIYINNNSNDGLENILKKKIKNLRNIKIFTTDKSKGIGPGIARNLGIKKTNSNLIMFLDIDDLIQTKYVTKLIRYCKNFKNNFIYLNIKSNKQISPYIKYNKKSLRKFFRNSNNMMVIGKIFKKQFLIKNNLTFSKNIFEDIFFMFKCHYYNNKKINYFAKNVYVKIDNPGSITNTKKTLNHIKCKFEAFEAIKFFLKKKNLRIYNDLYKDIQYRFRGEFSNEYQNIISSNLKRQSKELFVSFTKKLYKNSIDKNFTIVTKKDRIVKKILFNV